MYRLARYLFIEHFFMAAYSAGLMFIGLFFSIFVIKYKITTLQWLPMRIINKVKTFIGTKPSLLRTTMIIWVFNASVMFFYMAGGFHPVIPKIFGIWTGLNIGVAVVLSQREGEGIISLKNLPEGAWRPSPKLGAVCGLAVLMLEMPSFFYSVALGLQMGIEVSWRGIPYLEAFQPRATAYGVIIAPILLLSAVAESIAIRAAYQES